jgi:hypothetical protein
MRLRRGFDQLRGDAEAIAFASGAALEHVVHASSRRMSSTDFFVPLKLIADVRAMTARRAGFTRLSSAIISSVRPSAKNSWAVRP